MLASFFLKDPPSYQVTIQITDVGPVGIHGGAGQLTSLPPSGKKPPQHHPQRIKTTTSHPRHQCTSRNLPATTTNTFLGWIFAWVFMVCWDSSDTVHERMTQKNIDGIIKGG
uniref:Uncharacterized protein n=1 Tax=Lactuca sativa TaxID=4236 RepID=A0A9R1X907_LACSA|nr:hypothetical protein LSAT_V11C500235970 [Lactuca sativa]